MFSHPALRLFLITIALICSPAFADSFTPTTSKKKIINYGQDWPNTAFARANIAQMEQRPYDGIIIAVSKEREPKAPSGDSIGNRAFSRERFEISDYQHAIDDLKATKFRKFTDNFIQVESMPEQIDFFDDEGWKTICHNFKTLAHIAHQGGCKGLEFDPEEYGPHTWTYTAWSEAIQKTHTQSEYIDKAIQRGREVMQAANSEFPDIRILFLFGPSFTYSGTQTGSQRYRLLGSFLEGMCTVATEGTQIIDGFEQSYAYRTPIAFAEGRKTQLASREIFSDKKAFDRVMRVGFGLWMDNNSGKIGWHPDETQKNHFQPETWQTAIHYALAYSDEYVWTWHERFNIWTGKNVNFDYLKAQTEAREKPGRLAPELPPEANRTPHATDVERHDDASTFADLQSSRALLLALPNTGWLFQMDPTDQGIKNNFERTDLDTKSWKPIEIGKFWEEQGFDYDGIAWYRTTFKLDAPVAETKVLLSIGAADESATVWLNGKQVAHQDIGEGGWNQRIDADITSALQPGDNVLAIRVIDRVGPGGLWKSIKLFTDQPPSSAQSK